MVENVGIEQNLLLALTGLTLKVTSKDLRKTLRRLESQLSFSNLTPNEQIPYVLQFCDDEILDFHDSVQTQKKLKGLTYEDWKEKMIERFDRNITKREFLKSKQGKEESCFEFFTRMEKMGSRIIEDEELILEIALLGCFRYKEEMETLALDYSCISEEFLEKVKKLEMIKKESWLRRKPKQDNFKPFNNLKSTINNVESSKDLIKEDKIYLLGNVFRLVVDTGSCYSFITNKVLQKLKVKTYRSEQPIKLLTCLLEEFIVDTYVELDFCLQEKYFRNRFYILPKRDDYVVLLGRDWLEKKKVNTDFVKSNTAEVALQRLCTDKNGGYKGDFKCEIITKPGYKVVEYPYRIQQAMEAKVDKEIHRLLEKGYIRESKSAWLNNVKPVDKPEGGVRLTTNLVKLNNLVELDSYSLPRMEEILNGLRGKKYFTKVDLKEGFFQIHLREQDKEKTAFRIKNRTYEWNRMPMGFKNSPGNFQRIMDKVLEEFIGKCCYVYVDDILIFSENEKGHDLAVIGVCDALSKVGFQANVDKVEYKKTAIEFLGHKVSYNKIYLIVDPKQGLEEYKTPENIEEVRRFIGIVNVYRRYIKNCAARTEPLSRLLRKGKDFIWGEEQEEAFRSLIETILSADCLTQPDFDKRFILTTDASNKGLGAVLSQVDDDGMERPIAFGSRQLRPAEFNYSITEKEMLAVLWGMEYFDFYLYGREFDVYTDHKALEAWNTKGKLNSARIERWNERLQRYSCNLKYKNPQELEHADALSRGSLNVVASIENVDRPEEIIKAHEEIVHRGAKATYEFLQKNKSEKNFTMKEVKQALKRCYKCKLYNPIKITGWRYIESYSPGEKVAFDVIGPIEGQYIVTAVDYFSRFAMAEAMDSRKTENLIKFLKKVHFELTIKTLVSDAARENISNELENWAYKNNIKRHITSSYHHNSNGRVERFNRTLGEALKKQDFNLTLEERIENAIRNYNETMHSATGLTPNEAMDLENLSTLKQRHFNNRIEKYKKLFKAPELIKLELHDMVLIEDAIHKVKGQPKFGSVGEVVGILNNDTYYIANATKVIKKHVTQLRKIEEDDFFL